MPSIEGTRGRRVSDRPTPAPEGPVSDSSPYPEERPWDAPALTRKRTSTRFFDSLLVRHLAAVAAVGLALLMRAVLAPYGQLPPYTAFYPFVLLAAILGGFWAGLLTTALSAAAAIFWVLPHGGEFELSSTGNAIRLAIFCATGTCVSVVAGLYHRQTHKLEAANAQLQTDIAIRKRVEEALRGSESRFRALFENSPIAVLLTTPDERIHAANPAACVMFGMSEAEICRAGRNGLVDLSDPRYAAAAEERQRTGRVVAAEFNVVRSNGNRFPAEVDSVILAGTPLQSFVMLRDITERKRAQEALRVSEERLRLLGDNLPNSAVYQYTHDPDGTPRFLYISAGVERLHGVKVEDVLRDGSVLYRQFLPDELPALLEAEKISARELSVFQREMQMQLPDGRLRWIHLLSRPRRLSDGRVIWDGVESDITERKRAEELLLRSEKLASLGRMAATIAHEINNPLDAVMNLLFLATSRKDLPEPAYRLLGTADAELRRIAHITRQSLGFYRESNAPTLTSLGAVLDSTVDLQKSRIKAKHAIIDKQWDENVRITAVEGELRQVFSNLVCNSLDAIDERGMIKLRVSARKHHVRITVADNGKGIPLGIRQHIFEPFFTTKDTVGTGLGLWVSQQIVEKHRGTIRVRSNTHGVRRGTTFSVVLPAGPAPATQSQSKAA